MNTLLNILLRTSLSAALSDREAFVDRAAQIIEQKVGSDTDAAHAMGERIAEMMESVDQTLLIRQLLAPPPPAATEELEKKIDELTQAINRLNDNLEKIKL
ncbi:hypothetical protein BN938_1148 [Mucinivorans hirudinis]|uniref:Uncharacterized protein n=1 Tax=Mucinivorans hirudinis TaxID=1433126 RepID=A0A060RBT4_9BACT|nr:hypothetical protein BN938_1148 [Mucinivorans hirudinis]